MRIAITGVSGFIGTHLRNYLGAIEGNDIVGIDRAAFGNTANLRSLIKGCDVIIHLAAVNRHQDPEILAQTNISIVRTLIDACSNSELTPHIIFSSSLQEQADNPYGQSKLIGRRMFEVWAQQTGSRFTSLTIPNVFGPFGKPFHNSVVATFCHQIGIDEEPNVVNDKEIPLIYINTLCKRILKVIQKQEEGLVSIEPEYKILVSEIRNLLLSFRQEYLADNVVPSLEDSFSIDLFNTFRCYLPHHIYPLKLKKNEDNRGVFIEIMRNQSGGQFSFSTTLPGVTRGNHFHTRKFERFTVIKGHAKIAIRRIDSNEIVEYILCGEEPAYVDMPVWHTHNITNVGEGELITLFWINEHYRPEDPDTYFVQV